MNVLEFITIIVAIIVAGVWGLAYLAYKYGDVAYKDENTTVKSNKKTK